MVNREDKRCSCPWLHCDWFDVLGHQSTWPECQAGKIGSGFEPRSNHESLHSTYLWSFFLLLNQSASASTFFLWTGCQRSWMPRAHQRSRRGLPFLHRLKLSSMCWTCKTSCAFVDWNLLRTTDFSDISWEGKDTHESEVCALSNIAEWTCTPCLRGRWQKNQLLRVSGHDEGCPEQEEKRPRLETEWKFGITSECKSEDWKPRGREAGDHSDGYSGRNWSGSELSKQRRFHVISVNLAMVSDCMQECKMVLNAAQLCFSKWCCFLIKFALIYGVPFMKVQPGWGDGWECKLDRRPECLGHCAGKKLWRIHRWEWREFFFFQAGAAFLAICCILEVKSVFCMHFGARISHLRAHLAFGFWLWLLVLVSLGFGFGRSLHLALGVCLVL